jgi:hypothetical protein
MANSDDNIREDLRQSIALQHATDLAGYNADLQRSLESFKAGNLAGRDALKGITLINGGAAVAMLAFLGHLASIQAGHETIVAFSKPLSWFVQGVFFGTLATGLIYFSSSCARLHLSRELERKEATRDNNPAIANQKSDAANFWKRLWAVVNTTTIVCGTYGLLCFVRGCHVGFRAFEVLQVARTLP